MSSPLDRYAAQSDAWKPDGPRCDGTVPIGSGPALSPLSDLVAAGVRLRNAQRRWAAGERGDDAQAEIGRVTAEFDELIAACED